MKKAFLVILIVLLMTFSTKASFAIPVTGLTEEQIIQKYEEIKKERDRLKTARDGKYEIIRKNNNTIEELKIDSLDVITTASMKVNKLLLQIQDNKVAITQDVIDELTELLQSIKEANQTIKQESTQLNEIVKLVKVKGYDSSVLSVLDSAIEKQNLIIVSYKQIISNLNN